MNKMANNDKTTSSCLRVKPPYEKRGFRHMMKFWKTGILMGGLTLMPRYKKQGQFHQGIPTKDGQSF
jgi:hypothetical protein